MSDSATCSKSYQEFVKFGKFFTTRLVQAVVQSRLGQLIVQSCSVQPDPTDWFSVRIDELGEVAAQLRTSVTKYPPNTSCFTLDFLLHTADGDILPLESWCIRYDSELVDTNVNVRTELYHQLGTLLKSAIVASRMTPAYRYYVRKQSPETFIIMYRVYEKEPEMDLGEEQKKVRIGIVASPFGGFSIDLHYRTKMEIDRTAQEVNVSTAVASENAETDYHQSSRDVEAPISIPFGPVPACGGAVEPVSPVSDLISNFSVDPVEQERSGELLFGTPPRRVHFHLGHSRSSSDDSCRREGVCGSCDENIFGLDRSNSPPYSSSLPHRMASSTKGRARTHSFPFSTLLTTAANNLLPSQELPGVLEDNDTVTPTSPAYVVHPPSPAPDPEPSASTCSAVSPPVRMHQCATVPSGVNLMNSAENDKQKQDTDGEAEAQSDDDDMTSSDDSYVKVAFGSSESLADGLGEFMKQCRSAPTHLSFQIDSTSVIPELLAQFEDKQKVFDNFLAEIKRKTQSEED